MASSNQEENAEVMQPDWILERTRQLQEAGLERSRAFRIADLEMKIAQWPEDWGDQLHVLIYGDFDPPEAVMSVPSLGITVYPEKLENTVIKSAFCVLKAAVEIQEKSIDGLINASRRINVFLGAWTLVEWGRGACGWWSWITHGTGAGVGTVLDHEDLPTAVEGLLDLPPELRQKVEAALFWVREPRNLLRDFYQGDTLRVYAGYWNAFECLVDAINLMIPRSKLSRADKQQLIDDFIAQRDGRLTAADVQRCYHEIVNPGFRGKAEHAIKVCIPQNATYYIEQCFDLPEKQNRLYQIRNDINHGNIDAENPEEIIRVAARLRVLWLIVWRMFGRLVRIPVPADDPGPLL